MNKSSRQLLNDPRPFGGDVDLADVILSHGKWPSRSRPGEYITLSDTEEAKDIAFDIHMVVLGLSIPDALSRTWTVDPTSMMGEICRVASISSEFTLRDKGIASDTWYAFLHRLARYDKVSSQFLVREIALGDVDLACMCLWYSEARESSTDDVFGEDFVETFLSRKPKLRDNQYKFLFKQCVIAFGTTVTFGLFSEHPTPNPEVIAKIPWELSESPYEESKTRLEAIFAVSEHGIGMDELYCLCNEFPDHQWTSMSSSRTRGGGVCRLDRKDKTDVNLIQRRRRSVVDLIGDVIPIGSLVGIISALVFAELRNID